MIVYFGERHFEFKILLPLFKGRYIRGSSPIGVVAKLVEVLLGLLVVSLVLQDGELALASLSKDIFAWLVELLEEVVCILVGWVVGKQVTWHGTRVVQAAGWGVWVVGEVGRVAWVEVEFALESVGGGLQVEHVASRGSALVIIVH
jgi:hypothetical protein